MACLIGLPVYVACTLNAAIVARHIVFAMTCHEMEGRPCFWPSFTPSADRPENPCPTCNSQRLPSDVASCYSLMVFRVFPLLLLSFPVVNIVFVKFLSRFDFAILCNIRKTS
jgi:hypothetical protein